jgi:hypothetical protein
MKILIAGCGGAPSEGVVNSLLKCDKVDEVIGMGSEPTDLILSGNHRIAALSALEFEYVPARLLAYHFINRQDVECWPQVRLGLWDSTNAQSYFDHLINHN